MRGPSTAIAVVLLLSGVSHAIPTVLHGAPGLMMNKKVTDAHTDTSAPALSPAALTKYYNEVNEAEEADGKLGATGMIISLTFLIGATMMFEYAKDQIIEATEKTRVFVMVEAMFGELTVLGASH